jgi:hypothetical protein
MGASKWGGSGRDHGLQLPPGKTFVAYPNPARNFLRAAFIIEHSAQVRIDLVGITGEVKKTLFLGTMPTGTSVAEFDLQNTAAGIYYLVLWTNEGQGFVPRQKIKVGIVR